MLVHLNLNRFLFFFTSDMITFTSDENAKMGINKVAVHESSDATEAACAGWVATRHGLFTRYLIADDLKQPSKKTLCFVELISFSF